MIEKAMTRKSREAVCGQNSLNGQKHEDIRQCSPKSHLSAKEDFVYQMDRMTCPVDPDLFSKPPISSFSGPMNKVAMVAGMEITCGLRKIGFHSPRSTLR